MFETVQAYDKVYEWFGILKVKYGADVIAYVIMPNYLHLIIHFESDGFNLNKIIANGKRFVEFYFDFVAGIFCLRLIFLNHGFKGLSTALSTSGFHGGFLIN